MAIYISFLPGAIWGGCYCADVRGLSRTDAWNVSRVTACNRGRYVTDRGYQLIPGALGCAATEDRRYEDDTGWGAWEMEGIQSQVCDIWLLLLEMLINQMNFHFLNGCFWITSCKNWLLFEIGLTSVYSMIWTLLSAVYILTWQCWSKRLWEYTTSQMFATNVWCLRSETMGHMK